MFKRIIVKISILFLLVPLFVSCKEIENLTTGSDIDTSQLPKWAISINQIIKYPRLGPGEQQVPSYQGEDIWVRKHYDLNSREIKEIEQIPSEEAGKYNLKLTLDRHGSMIAMRLCNETMHAPWGLLVDGVYYGTVSVKKATEVQDDYSMIILECPMDKATSSKIAEYSEANYEHFHPDDK